MADDFTSESLANMAYSTVPHQQAERSQDSETQALDDVACGFVPQGTTDIVDNTQPCRSAEVANNSASGSVGMAHNGELHRPAEMQDDSVAQVLADETYSSVLHGPADMVHNVEPCGHAETANDSEPSGRTAGDFCEFQYIEIVPLDSPKEAAHDNEHCSNEVKEEIKEEPEDVCNIFLLMFFGTFTVLCLMFCI